MKKLVAQSNGKLMTKPVKSKLTLTIDRPILLRARNINLNISAFLEMRLRELFEVRERVA